MREKLTRPKLHAFLERLGEQARTPGACYLTGGACALLEGWRERSRFVGQFGNLPVFQYDFVSQALSKVQRGHDRDLADVEEMLRRGLVTGDELSFNAEAIRPQLLRYPAIDEARFLERVKDFLDRRRHV